MNTQEFIDAMKLAYADSLAIVKAKNKDYSTESNPFRNFEYAQYVNVDVPDAILVRISDKLARVANLIHQEGRAVMDERIEDTLCDLANYAIILKVYLEDKKKHK